MATDSEDHVPLIWIGLPGMAGKRPAEAPAERPAPHKHLRTLGSHLAGELGSEHFSDVVVVLATHRRAAAAPSSSSEGGPAAAVQEEGSEASGSSPAAAAGHARALEGARRVFAHATILALSPIWRAELMRGDGGGYVEPLPREGTRKVSRWNAGTNKPGMHASAPN